MKALIIAAGEGKRIRDVSKNLPKPLTPLLGLSLIERVILSAKSAGINDFVIVLGYKGDKVREKLGDGSKYGVSIEYVENKEWKKGNGLSVLSAEDKINENFILLMSDHLFDPDVLREVRRRKLAGADGILVIDRGRRDHIDLEDATKVRIRDDMIVDIGKNLDEFDGIDCGIFLFSERIFDALKESLKRGDDTLSGGVRVLAENGRMRFMDIGNGFWIDIDTRKSLKFAEKHLLKSLIKSTDGPISRYINRKVSIPISKFLVENTRVSPNAISIVSFLISLLSAFLFSFGQWLYIALAGLLAQFSSIIDGCDGEIARLKFRESEYGAWMDSVLDRYADCLVIFGMMYGHWMAHTDFMIWIWGFFAAVGGVLNSYTAIKFDQIVKRRKIKYRFGRDIRLFIIMLGSIVNQIFLTLIILAFLTNIENLRRVIISSKQKDY